MRKNEIKVGGKYRAKVSGKLTTVVVNSITETEGRKSRIIPADPAGTGLGSYRSKGYKAVTHYHCTNLATGRKTTFRSAAKFRCEDLAALKTVRGNRTVEVMAASPPPVDKVMQEAEEKRLRTAIGANSEFEAATSAERPSDPTQVPARPATLVEEPVAASNPTTPLGKILKASADLVKNPDTAPHLIVEARAGTGKTTTLIEGLKRIKGIPSSLVPSPQQAAVWEAMELSKGHAKTICFVAFNKSIATELQRKVPMGCDAMTMHSMGFKAINKSFPRLQVSEYRVDDLICNITGYDIKWLRANKPQLLKATKELVGLCKMNLVFDDRPTTSETLDRLWWDEQLLKLVSHYDVDLNGSQREVFDLVPKVLEACKDPLRDRRIDFDDMIWLPVVLNLPVFQYDLLLVDEAQDLNRCQQALAKRAGRRLILCGDPKQAIYGFAGADSESMSRMEVELHTCGSPNGCRDVKVLPLTVTRRCGKAIVREAQRLVPDFDFFESNAEGLVSSARFNVEDDKISPPRSNCNYRSDVKDGDFLLCRVNAPLVSECFKFIKQGRKANIQGRDVGKGLISTLEKLCKDPATPVTTVIEKLDEWFDKECGKENAKKNPSETRLMGLQDRHDCLMCFCHADAVNNVSDVVAKINAIFTDNKDITGIRLSSIHKAKGLEAKRVFILQPKGASIPHPMAKTAWQREQEMNLLYVAITRAIEELVYVS